MVSIKTTVGPLVKHNGLMLAKPAGNALTIFDLSAGHYRTKEKIRVLKNEEILKSISLNDLREHKLAGDERYDFGNCETLKEFCEQSIPVGRLVGLVKEILYHATRKGSKVVVVVEENRDDYLSVLSGCCQDQGIYLTDVAVLHRGQLYPGCPYDKVALMVTSYLGGMDYHSVRLFSDNQDHLDDFLSLRARFGELVFEGYWVGRNGDTRLKM